MTNVEGAQLPRQLAEKPRVHRRTVRQALESAQPPERKTPGQVGAGVEDFKPAIKAMLRPDLEAQFSGWTKTFADPRLCAAIVDRLTYNGHIIETGTTSCRLAHTLSARGVEQA